MSMLPVTSASYSRILNWFIHVVDNCSEKINLICNESLFQFFQQIDMVKVYGKTDKILILGIFSTSSKSDILLNQLAMLSLDKHFVTHFLQTIRHVL